MSEENIPKIEWSETFHCVRCDKTKPKEDEYDYGICNDCWNGKKA